MRILVTGADGFVGRHLAAALARDHNIVPVDRSLPTGWDLQFGFPVECLDGVDCVVHLAAQVGREFGEDDLLHTVASNAGVTALVAHACGEMGVRLVYASTSEIYGNGYQREWEEDDFPVDDYWRSKAAIPANLYGLSKRWGEEACRLYAPDNLTIVRLSMPYGPGLPAGRGRAAIINFLYDALWDRPLCVHARSERSWCWVGDTVSGIRLLVEGGHAGAFNVGRDDNPLPMRRVAEIACDLTGASHDLIYEVDPPANQTAIKRLSTEKIRRLGWRPTMDLETGMRKTLAYVKTLPAPDVAAAA